MKRNQPRIQKTAGQAGLQDRLLRLIYNHALGRALIRPLTHPAISKIGGCFLDSALSLSLIHILSVP